MRGSPIPGRKSTDILEKRSRSNTDGFINLAKSNQKDIMMINKDNYNDPLKFDEQLLVSEKIEYEEEEEGPTEVTIYDLKGFEFTRKKVMAVYILLFMLNMGNNLDHGAIPVAIPVMKKDLNVNQ